MESYRAAAIVTLEGKIPFLDKFAVTLQAQGAGIGSSLWHRMRDENPKLFWRARHDNPINPWYFERSDGTFRDRQWIVFWYGLDGFDEVKESIQRALSLPPSLLVGGLSLENGDP